MKTGNDIDLKAALQRHLASMVTVTEKGVSRKVPMMEAAVIMFFERLPKAPLSQQIAAFKLLLGAEFAISQPRSRDIPADAIAQFVAGLVEEVEEAEQDRELWQGSSRS